MLEDEAYVGHVFYRNNMSERSVNLEELTQHKLLWGDLLWKKKNGHSTRIGSCGDFVDLEFVQKLISKNAELEINSYTDWSLVNEVSEIFEKLKEASTEAERIAQRSLFCKKFFPVFLGSENGSYIDWFTICFRTFYKLPEDIEEIYYLKNSDALKRSMAVASMTTLISFCLGYMNFEFLSKIYNSALIMDLDFVQKGMSEFHLKDLEAQRNTDSPKLDGNLLSHFIHHGSNIDEYIDRVTDGEIIFKNMIRFHHELFDSGKGPESIYDSEVGDLVQVIAFVERFIPYRGFDLRNGDATGALTDFIGKVDGFQKLKAILRTEVSEAA